MEDLQHLFAFGHLPFWPSASWGSVLTPGLRAHSEYAAWPTRCRPRDGGTYAACVESSLLFDASSSAGVNACESWLSNAGDLA